MNYEEQARDILGDKGRLGGTEGFAEHETRAETMRSGESKSKIQRLVDAAITHAEDQYKNITMITEIDLSSLRTWPDGDRIDPEGLKEMIRDNGGSLDIMVDRVCEDIETGEPKLNDESPLSLRGAEYERGELILITDTDVYTTIDFNQFEHDRGLDNQEIGRDW